MNDWVISCFGARSNPNRGFILIAVIWIAGLLAVMATALTASTRVHFLAGRNSLSGTRAEQIADGLARFTALNTTKLTAPTTGPQDGSWQACTWGAHDAWIAVQSQAGLVDVNTASPALIAALLKGIAPAEQAMRLAAEIRDFRDADRDAERGGVEPDIYPGRDYGPKNSPFTVIEELDQVPGMTPATFARLLPLVTVQSQQTGIAVDQAPAELLAILGINRNDAGTSPFSTPAASRFLGITVAVQMKDGTHFVRTALATSMMEPERPFVFTGWSTGAWPDDLPVTTDAAVRPCLP